jgi:hypothetical protein
MKKYVKESLDERFKANLEDEETSGPVASNEQGAFREAAEKLLNALLDDGWDIDDACTSMVETIGELGEYADFERGGEPHE